MNYIYSIWMMCILTVFFSILNVSGEDLTHIQPIIASFFISLFAYLLQDNIK